MDDKKNKNQTDDFFRLITEEDNIVSNSKNEIIENPFADDEIVFKDETGQIKVLKGGKVTESKPSESKSADKPKPIIPIKQQEPAQQAKSIPVGKPLDVKQEVERIIQKSQVNFSEPEKSQRFKSIILARLKDVRDQMETREILSNSSDVGGMDFDDKTTDRVLQLINQEIEQLEEKAYLKTGSGPFAGLQAEAEKILSEKPALSAQPAIKESVQPTVRPARSIKRTAPVVQQSFTRSKPLTPQAPQQRPKIEDVKFKPRLVGPIEEIGALNLTDFRRLAQSPEDIIEKILEKINILEEESFSKKIEAIKVWKQSDVYQLYLEIGGQSMENKTAIADIIVQREKNGQPTLSEAEFEAISDLNQKLRH